MRQGSRILIVEDDLAFAEILRHSLSNRGFECDVAATVREVWSRLQQADGPLFELVIADVRLPQQSGVELLFPGEQVKHRPGLLMITAFASPELKDFLAGLGITLLEKPFSLDQLHTRVVDLLIRRQGHWVLGHL